MQEMDEDIEGLQATVVFLQEQLKHFKLENCSLKEVLERHGIESIIPFENEGFGTDVTPPPSVQEIAVKTERSLEDERVYPKVENSVTNDVIKYERQFEQFDDFIPEVSKHKRNMNDQKWSTAGATFEVTEVSSYGARNAAFGRNGPSDEAICEPYDPEMPQTEFKRRNPTRKPDDSLIPPKKKPKYEVQQDAYANYSIPFVEASSHGGLILPRNSEFDEHSRSTSRRTTQLNGSTRTSAASEMYNSVTSTVEDSFYGGNHMLQSYRTRPNMPFASSNSKSSSNSKFVKQQIDLDTSVDSDVQIVDTDSPRNVKPSPIMSASSTSPLDSVVNGVEESASEDET